MTELQKEKQMAALKSSGYVIFNALQHKGGHWRFSDNSNDVAYMECSECGRKIWVGVEMQPDGVSRIFGYGIDCICPVTQAERDKRIEEKGIHAFFKNIELP